NAKSTRRQRSRWQVGQLAGSVSVATASATGLRMVGGDGVAGGVQDVPGAAEGGDGLAVCLAGAAVAGVGGQRPAVVGDVQVAGRVLDGAQQRGLDAGACGGGGHALGQFGVGPDLGAPVVVGAGDLAAFLGGEHVQGAALAVDQDGADPGDVGG